MGCWGDMGSPKKHRVWDSENQSLLKVESFWIVFDTVEKKLSKKITTHPKSTPQAIPLANYERNPIIACW